jgi:hypothetical protein
MGIKNYNMILYMHMKYFVLPLTFLLSIACQSLAQNYAGSFKGVQAGITSSAELTVQDRQLRGRIIMNGKGADVNGIIKDSTSSGKVYDIELNKSYVYFSTLSRNELHFFITFPELNNQAIELILKRDDASAEKSSIADSRFKTYSKDAKLYGVWRYTEVISSGSGDNYASFSTDYFMEFKADGTAFSWTGKSAGGSGNISIEGKAPASAEKGQWYTEGKTLFLIDPVTKQKVSILYFAEENRMMLHNGGNEKKVFQRIR